MRNFLKHAEEVQDDEAMLEVHRTIFDLSAPPSRATNARMPRNICIESVVEVVELRGAARFFSGEYRRISDHTNFEMAARSLAGCVRQIDEILADCKGP